MKQTTYSIIDGEKTLVKENFFDEYTNLIHVIDHTMRPREELKFSYNDKHQLIRKVMIIDGNECDALEMDYNSEGQVCEQRHFINGEIYEEITFVKSENGWIRTEIQDGEEAARWESTTEDGVEKVHHYEYGELVQVNTITEIDSVTTTVISLPGSNVEYTSIETVNEHGETIELKNFSTNGELEDALTQTFDGKNLQKVEFKSYTGFDESYEHVMTYDQAGNRIKFEQFDATGRLTQFEKSRFNDENRVIERAGHNGSKKYHYEYEYSA